MSSEQEGIDYIVDHYAVLDVERDISEKDLKVAFQRLANKYHPDKYASLAHEYQKDADRKMQLFIKSHDVLKDTVQRKAYDLQLKEWEDADKPVSSNGNPIITLGSVFSATDNLTDEEFANGEARLESLLASMSGYNEQSFEQIRKMFESTDSPDHGLKDAYAQQLTLKKMYLDIKQEKLLEMIGYKPSADVSPVLLSNRRTEALNNDLTRHKEERSQLKRTTLLQIAGSDGLKLLQSGDTVLVDLREDPEKNIATYLEQYENRIDGVNEKVRELDILRQEANDGITRKTWGTARNHHQIFMDVKRSTC